MIAVLEPQARDSAEHWREIAPVLDQELKRLPDKYRAAIVCCDIEGRSRSEAARRLGWPEGTLKVRLREGRTLLAKRLTRRGIVLSAGALAVVVSENAASAGVPAALAISTAKAAGALAATKAASVTSVATKVEVLAKGVLKPLIFGKAAVVTAGGSAVIAALLLINPATKSPEPASKSNLPAEIQQALEENARQLSPLSVACTTQMKSALPPEQTFDRLKLTEFQRSKRFFAQSECQVIWKDGKLYVSHKSPDSEEADAVHVRLMEFAFDGRVVAQGSLAVRPMKMIGQQTRNSSSQKGSDRNILVRNLWKEPAEKALKRSPNGIGSENPYFHPVVGLVIATNLGNDAQGTVPEPKIYASESILNDLRRGGRLLSVENATLNGQQCVRIELEVENQIQKYAMAFDLDRQKKMLRDSTENQKKSSQLSKQQQEMMQRMQRQQETTMRLIEEQRKLPVTRRYVYYLDPKLHYAVRRFEQFYGADTLLARADCTDFEQIPGRSLWLPRQIKTDLHEHYSVPGTVFKESFLSQVVEVSQFDGSDVPDEKFTIKYTQPGTIVSDGTDLTASKSPDGYLRYTIPEDPKDLPNVIERARKGENMAPNMLAPTRPSAEPEVALGNYRNESLIKIALCNLALLGAVAAFVIWRRRTEGAR